MPRDYELRLDGDIEYIPDDMITDLVVDHETQRVYIITTTQEK